MVILDNMREGRELVRMLFDVRRRILRIKDRHQHGFYGGDWMESRRRKEGRRRRRRRRNCRCGGNSGRVRDCFFVISDTVLTLGAWCALQQRIVIVLQKGLSKLVLRLAELVGLRKVAELSVKEVAAVMDLVHLDVVGRAVANGVVALDLLLVFVFVCSCRLVVGDQVLCGGQRGRSGGEARGGGGGGRRGRGGS